ncbi:MAG: glycine cleavage system aminomethyltransferase GcvT [Chloroflexota bacterium]
MSDAPTGPMRETVLHGTHVRLGGRMVPFAGYDMPVQYEGILAESRAVRTGAGIFDVSHMGRFFVEGPDARALLDWLHTADIGERMPIGRARYGLFCNEAGGIIDDGIVYRLGPERFLLIANAANAAEVLAWARRWQAERFGGCTLTDRTGQVAMIALQGPRAVGIAAEVTGFDPAAVRPFHITEGTLLGAPGLTARTGYTGEDGVELMPASEHAPALWARLMEAGAVPCGLGARDALRLEAGLLLHGHDMDATVNPIEAGLAQFVALSAGDFCGKPAVARAAADGTARTLAGLRTRERGAVPRPGAPVLAGDAPVGQVCSGGFGPTVEANIALAYLPTPIAVPGMAVQIDVRGRLQDGEVVPLPFYARPR